MHLALFDLDDALIDHQAAFLAWAEEFAASHGLGSEGVSRLLAAKAKYSGPKDRLFSMVRVEFDLAEPVDLLWRQYRRRIPELAMCRPEDLDALEQLRGGGWRIGIVTNGMPDNQLAKILGRDWPAWLKPGASRTRSAYENPIRGSSASRRNDAGCRRTAPAGWWVAASPSTSLEGGRRTADRLDQPVTTRRTT